MNQTVVTCSGSSRDNPWILLLSLLIALHFVAQPATAIAAEPGTLTLAPIFSDHAVLQRDRPLPVWGTGTPEDIVKVQLGSVVSETVVGVDGTWQLILNAQPASENLSLRVYQDGKLVTEKTDVAVGDVWLCSGQSNMEFELHKAANGASEAENSNDNGLRLLLMPRKRAFKETTLGEKTHWQRSAPDTAKNFSAACYYMGREMRRQQNIPIGLIAASWGGSKIEDWLSRASLLQLGGFADELAAQAEHIANPAGSKADAAQTLRSWVQKHAGVSDITHWIKAPLESGLWEGWTVGAFAEFDGVARYRIRFSLPSAIAKRARSLALGRIDDADWTSVNGVEVGNTQKWDTVRRYPLKKGVLRAGTNTIDIVVLDTGGGGGLWGGEMPAIALEDGTKFPLERGWEAAAVKTLDEAGPPPVAAWLQGEGAGTLHNGMIAPLGHFAVKGFAWYQGESNAAYAARYPLLLQALISDWRSRFGGQTFLAIQLAGFGAHSQNPERSRWAELREAQRSVAIANPAVRLVPTIDIGDRFDIHPVNKKEVGRRLALAASSDDWRVGTQIRVEQSGHNFQISLGEDYRLVGGGASPIGFELCDHVGMCRFIPATLLQPDLISIDAAEADSELRYLWSNSPLVSLYDTNGVPLPPFRILVKK